MSEYITLEQMLEFREKKAQMQDTLRLRYSGTITVALGMNIPGPKKTDEAIVRAFREGCRELETVLERAGLNMEEKIRLEEAAGNVAFFCVAKPAGEEGFASQVKRLTVEVEELHPLGRLFDIDVYAADGTAVSRQQLGAPGRRCLICQEDAKVCGRSRAHSVQELQQQVYEIIRSWEASGR